MNLTDWAALKPNPLFRNFRLVVLCVLFAAGGLVQGQDSASLVSESLIQQAGLKKQWQIRLPIKTKPKKDRAKEKVDRLFVFDQYLLVLTSQNYLFCRNRMDGSYRFEMQIADKGLPVIDPLYIDKRVLFLVGSQLKILDPVSGMIVRTVNLDEVGENRNACIAKNDKFVYIAGVDRRVHAFKLQEDGDYVQLFTATADNDSVITSILAADTRVYFATLAGNIVAMEPDKPARIWQYNASGAITAPLVLEGDSLYAGGQDTKLYKISTETGTLQWDTPFFAGDKILDAPEIGKTIVYLNTGINGVYGISRQTGKEVWNVPQGAAVLSESEDRAYVYARPGVLVVMNNTTGKEAYSLNFAGVTRYAADLKDAVLYVADAGGRVECISLP